jgi:hydroxymethylbilane synthase
MAKNPTFKCVNFRGNVQTQLRKLDDGVTLLATAGLKRMGMEGCATSILEWDDAAGCCCAGCHWNCAPIRRRTRSGHPAAWNHAGYQVVHRLRAFVLEALMEPGKDCIAAYRGRKTLRLIAMPDGALKTPEGPVATPLKSTQSA